MNRYTVMGSTPGDGGIVYANGYRDAFAQFMKQTWGASKKDVLKDIKNVPTEIISKDSAVIGDYVITRTKAGLVFRVYGDIR